jgi:hypothetical protein
VFNPARLDDHPGRIKQPDGEPLLRASAAALGAHTTRKPILPMSPVRGIDHDGPAVMSGRDAARDPDR